ncbi:MAG: HD domain-containing protein [Fidelibacterota bacterium]
MNREEAYSLLTEYTSNPNLIKHALAVESAMRWYARYYGEDEEKWGIAGLLHDFDYERYPTAEDHPGKGAEILKAKGYPEDLIYAIKSHADHMGLERRSRMDRTLFAVDELSGFLTAVALVMPNKKISEVKVKSVKKKIKDKAFARNVSRDDIRKGAEQLGIELEEHIANMLKAMVDVADKLGL